MIGVSPKGDSDGVSAEHRLLIEKGGDPSGPPNPMLLPLRVGADLLRACLEQRS